MSQVGGDLAALGDLKASFENQAQRIDELISTIGGRLANTYWEGPAANRFRGQWGSEFEPSLRNMRVALEECGVEVARRIVALENAAR